MLMSAKTKKFHSGDQSMRLYTTVSQQQRRFLKIDNFFIRRTYNRWSNQESKTKYSPLLQGNRHTDTQNPLPIPSLYSTIKIELLIYQVIVISALQLFRMMLI